MTEIRRDWRGYNGGQATKDDLLDVCESLEIITRGMKVVYRERDFRVSELRKKMRELLVETAKQRNIQIVSKT